MTMMKHRLFIITALFEIIVLFGLILQSQFVLKNRISNEIPQKKQLVRQLELTDLAIWTEARYTRHPSQADYFSPFQDCPSSLEHFPAGSVVAVPDTVRSAVGTESGTGD